MHLELKSANTSTPAMTVLVHTPAGRTAIPHDPCIRVLRQPDRECAEQARNLFVLVPATELRKVAKFVSCANRRHQLRALFIQDDLDPYWLPLLFEKAGLRTMRNVIVHSDFTLPGRVLRAWANGAQSELIADARMAKDRLFVLSCALEPYDVSADEIPSLRSIPKSERSFFEIDEDGSYLYWPKSDVHLDLGTIRTVIDPSRRDEALQKKLTHDRRYGAAIAQLRSEKGLTQSDIQGLSERQVRRIEHGECASYKALQRLAAAHELSLGHYLDKLAKTMARSPATLTSATAGAGE